MFSHSESIDGKHKNVSSFCRNVFVPMGVIEIALYSLNAKSSNFYPSLRLRTLWRMNEYFLLYRTVLTSCSCVHMAEGSLVTVLLWESMLGLVNYPF